MRVYGMRPSIQACKRPILIHGSPLDAEVPEPSSDLIHRLVHLFDFLPSFLIVEQVELYRDVRHDKITATHAKAADGLLPPIMLLKEGERCIRDFVRDIGSLRDASLPGNAAKSIVSNGYLHFAAFESMFSEPCRYAL